MYRNVKDLTGQTFDKLTILSFHESVDYKSTWLCRCECGNEVVKPAFMLKRKGIKSCGCLKSDGSTNPAHGFGRHNLYPRWRNMIERCHDPEHPAYRHYGKRGISVCKEWRENIGNFIEWCLSTGYEEQLTIERVDVNEGYSPENCIWANWKIQNNNKRNNIMITIGNETKNLQGWSEHTGIGFGTIHNRYYKLGMVGEELIAPIDKKRRNKRSKNYGA